MKNSLNSRILAALFAAYAAAMAVPGPAHAEIADLSNVPLANSPSDAVLPNLMYILDDSGSMRWDYMPDNIHRLTNNTELLNCKDSTTNPGTIQCSNGYQNGAPDGHTSTWGEPPYYTSDFNKIYYNPDVYYAPAVDNEGVSLGDSNYSSAKRDGFKDATAKNLGTEYADVYYCTTTAGSFTATFALNIMTVTAVAAGTTIKIGDRLRSAAGLDTDTEVTKFVTGSGGTGTYIVSQSQTRTSRTVTIDMPASPSSDRLANTNLCRRNGIDNVSSGYFLYWSNNATTGGYPNGSFTQQRAMFTGMGHYYKITPNEYCSDTNLRNCQLATAPAGAFTIPAPLRYCDTAANAASTAVMSDAANDTTPKCQKNFNEANFKFPRYGRFTRVQLTGGPFTKSANAVRPDCASAASCTLAEEQRNFANWYTWYRTRLTMMKTATGHAFLDINDRYRVGFITINPGSPVATAPTDTAKVPMTASHRYLPIRKFETVQKKDFYDILYATTNNGSTPLREALARVGRHYANVTTGINSGMSTDPITHSCQQNFALLTTDGYWNDDDENARDITASGTVGNQDNTPTAGAPIYVSRATGTIDGLDTQERIDTPFLLVEQAKCVGNAASVTFPTSGPTRACGCAGTQTRILERTLGRMQRQSQTGGENVGAASWVNIAGSESFREVTGCTTPLIVTQVTPKVETQRTVCTNNNNTNFAGATGSPHQVSCGCGVPGSGTRYKLMQRTKTYNETIVYTDGAAGTATQSTPGYTFTSINPASGGCPTSNPGGGTAASTGNGTPIPAPTSNGGTNLTAAPSTPPIQNGSPTTVTINAVGTANTLADVAMYYYKNDLRTAMTDNVPTTDKDVADHQHMVTFSLGLGLKGEMEYISNYEAVAGDFSKIKNAEIGTCSWITDSGQRCDWPKPVSGAATTLDDLWHAAVNGRGLYYSASDPNTLSDSLSGALSALKIQNAAASASATSSPNITETENYIYSSTFRTVKWDGEVVAQRIDPITGNVIPTIEWSAQQKLDARIKTNVVAGDSDDRKIYTFDPGASNGRKEFRFDLLTGTIGGLSEQKWFDARGSALSQYSTLTAGQKKIADDGTSLVNYLRGHYQHEGTVFRDRDHVLGDPINATPAFMAQPRFAFNDVVVETYDEFKGRVKGLKRPGVLYIAANDGMLHALHGDTGQELWAYVPRIVFPKLHLLATDQWNVLHEYNVDGSPSIMDIYDEDKKEWRTILVAGLNKGGRGYYAMDVTDPETTGPLPLWEICAEKTTCDAVDEDMGFSYGNPVITKRASDGKWVVIVTSGMNNVSPGTGRGYLYVLDALKGTILDKVEAENGTAWGDTGTPSGFAKISAFANNFNSDNTATYVYGGDLFGNLWRFDMSASPPKVLKMAELKDASGKPQSITSRPELGVIEGHRVVFVGTGRYLGQDDLSDPATLSPPNQWAYQQSVYAIKDKDEEYGDPRQSKPGLVQQVLTDTKGVRTITNNTVRWADKDGWYVDFNPGTSPGSSPGERVNLDPQLILGTLVVTTNVPNKNACSTGGDSFLYQFNYASGTNVGTTGGVVAQKFSSQITVGVVIVRLPSGVFKGIATGATGTKTSVGVNLGSGGGSGRRVSWRELVQ